ncbi:MAG: hypothetical protein LBT46_02405 [Planctomycetaceae bacterium]|jgi:phosphate transport system substrate-binding protein|nr:hypothetical protein [Planctomycetaceae bacterium]
MKKIFPIVPLFILTAGISVAQTSEIPQDVDLRTRIYSSQHGVFGLPSENGGEQSVKLQFPDDPELNRLYEQKLIDAEKYSSVLKQQQDAGMTLKQSETEIARYILNSRLEEIRKRQPKTPPDGSKAKLDTFNFPELDGSTSCIPLGRIVAARVLDIPYIWTLDTGNVQQNAIPDYREPFRPHIGNSGSQIVSGYPYPGMDQMMRFQRGYVEGTAPQIRYSVENVVPMMFQIAADSAKTPFRRRHFFDHYFGFFQGTPHSYLSLAASKCRDALPQNQLKSFDSSVKNQNMLPFSEIILVARKPSKDERTKAEKFGVEFDVRPIALDGLVFQVHRRNPITNLSLEQICSIYLTKEQGQCRWENYGGKKEQEQVRILERERNSGSRELMDELVITDTVLARRGDPDSSAAPAMPVPVQVQQLPPPFSLPISPADDKVKLREAWDNIRRYRQTPVGYGMTGSYFTTVQDTKSISYSVYYYEHFMISVPEIRVISVNGVLPNYETIRSKKYPLTYEVYVVTLKGIAKDSPAARLRNWLLSEDGQRCIRESGYVPINPVIATE